MVQLSDGRAEREGVAARRLRQTRAVDKPPTPVDVLTGFLGAGKTTLVQRLLTDPPNGARIGVIVNDLAATNIDAVLLADTRNEDDGVVRLQNGCACCSLGSDLLEALDNLRKGGERRGYDYDQVVVECSGVARPQNVVKLIASGTVQRTALRHVVAVVDTAAFHEALASRDRAAGKEASESGEKVAQLLADQLEVADSVVLNNWTYALAESPRKSNSSFEDSALELPYSAAVSAKWTWSNFSRRLTRSFPLLPRVSMQQRPMPLN